MGAFIGYGDTGVWATNSERDRFLDWYAAHRCQPHDERWEYCKSEAQRWSGCCIELGDLIPQGELFEVSDAERADASSLGSDIPKLLGIIRQITAGAWQHQVSSREALYWRDDG